MWGGYNARMVRCNAPYGARGADLPFWGAAAPCRRLPGRERGAVRLPATPA